jgi:hypothetical protein
MDVRMDPFVVLPPELAARVLLLVENGPSPLTRIETLERRGDGARAVAGHLLAPCRRGQFHRAVVAAGARRAAQVVPCMGCLFVFGVGRRYPRGFLWGNVGKSPPRRNWLKQREHSARADRTHSGDGRIQHTSQPLNKPTTLMRLRSR